MLLKKVRARKCDLPSPGDNQNQAILSSSHAQSKQEERADDLLYLWRWAKSLDRRVKDYERRFEWDIRSALKIDHAALAAEVRAFNAAAQSLGPTK